MLEKKPIIGILTKPDTFCDDKLFTHQMIYDGVKNMQISAYSDDGYVEAVELKDKKFCLGLKWHADLMVDDEKMNEIFKRFIQTCF